MKIFLVVALLGLVACTHLETPTSSPRKPAADGGDVGSVGTRSVSCAPDDATIAKLKNAAAKAAKIDLSKNGGSIFYQQQAPQNQSNKINTNPDRYESFIKSEFGENSAMRNQVLDQIIDLEGNGHNTNDSTNYLTVDELWCNDIHPTKIKVTRLSGDPNAKEVLQAEITFHDGFHGGYELVKMYFQFETTTQSYSSSGILYVSSSLTKYPLYQKTVRIECDFKDGTEPKICDEAGE